MNIFDKFRMAWGQRARVFNAYDRLFTNQPQPGDAELVMADLARFCDEPFGAPLPRSPETGMVCEHALGYAMGKKAVFKRITQQLYASGSILAQRRLHESLMEALNQEDNNED